MCVRENERDSLCVCERERESESERECVCERKREGVCVRERVCVCVCVRERERERHLARSLELGLGEETVSQKLCDQLQVVVPRLGVPGRGDNFKTFVQKWLKSGASLGVSLIREIRNWKVNH